MILLLTRPCGLGSFKIFSTQMGSEQSYRQFDAGLDEHSLVRETDLCVPPCAQRASLV